MANLVQTLCFAGAGFLWPFSAMADCSALLSSRLDKGPQRGVTAQDLIELRDIGQNWMTDPASQVFDLSPDGRSIAFSLMQANVGSNSYCFGIVVVSVVAPLMPRLVATGGDYMLEETPIWGFAVDPQPSGVAKMVVPKWSPDGQWIAYLRRDGGVNQVWRAKADGGGAAPVTSGPSDIEAFAWARNGQSLIVRSRPGLLAMKASIQEEGNHGYLYDGRFISTVAKHPLPRGEVPHVDEVVDLFTDTRTLGSKTQSDVIDVDATHVQSPMAQEAFAELDYSNGYSRPKVIWTSGKEIVCDQDECRDAKRLWWRKDGRALQFLRPEGPQSSRTVVYEWALNARPPKALLVTSDLLLGCGGSAGGLICAQEGPLQPRRIVSIDLSARKFKTIFDPNPNFSRLRLGASRRLFWRNARGLETYGDLVLPPDHRQGQRHPLIVVQYRSRGFLRGGTGDEYPIQLLAAHGFAVLSFERPIPMGVAAGMPYGEVAIKFGNKDWQDRRSILSALETGIERAVDTGTIDGTRIGLTGLSDGATTVRYALINGRFTYAAAAISNCCVSPMGLTVLGPAGTDTFMRWGYPHPTNRDEAFWQPVSFTLNADRMDTPLLIQVPDDEYLSALEDYSALASRKKPVEMFVYPDEFHIKWQPAHRAASYQRTVEWFDFWLNNHENPDVDDKAQYGRWRKLKGIEP